MCLYIMSTINGKKNYSQNPLDWNTEWRHKAKKIYVYMKIAMKKERERHGSNEYQLLIMGIWLSDVQYTRSIRLIHSVATFTIIKLTLLLTIFNACWDIHNNHKKIVHSNKTHHIPDVLAATDLTSAFLLQLSYTFLFFLRFTSIRLYSISRRFGYLLLQLAL